VPSLYHDDVLGGYVVEFDVRDVGQYWLQLGVDWYFGDSEPEMRPDPRADSSSPSASPTVLPSPTPLSVSGFQGFYTDYRKSDELRAMVHWGREIRVVLSERDESSPLPVFGSGKCVDGEAAGRWLNMGDKACEAPYCTGNRTATVNSVDWDNLVSKVWVWVPYACYYHLYSKEDLYSCASKKNVSWIHTQGDSQEREFVSMMKQVNGSKLTVTKYEFVRLCSSVVFVMQGIRF
jgi:hypothetical protein